MTLTIEFDYQPADPHDPQSAPALDRGEARLDGEPCFLGRAADQAASQLLTALAAQPLGNSPLRN
jgi:hypothetical protein